MKTYYHTRCEFAHHLNMKGEQLWIAKACRLKAPTTIHAANNRKKDQLWLVKLWHADQATMNSYKLL